jgi:hypothetical protein
VNLASLAHQLGVTANDLLMTARRLDLAVEEIDSPIDAAMDFALCVAVATSSKRPRSQGLPLNAALPRRSGRQIREADLSDLAKIILHFIDTDPTRRWVSEYRPNTLRNAEHAATEWAGLWFEPGEVRQWLTLHPRISPAIADTLRKVGLTAADAAEPMIYNRNIAIAVSCGDITAEQAAINLKRRHTAA